MSMLRTAAICLSLTAPNRPPIWMSCTPISQEWGITVQPEMVIDQEYNISDDRYVLAALSDSSVNDALSAISDQVHGGHAGRQAAQGRAVRPCHRPDGGGAAADRPRETAYSRAIQSDTTYDSYDKQDGDTDGPFDLAALAEYTGNDEGGQIMVCSSALMMTDQLMQPCQSAQQRFPEQHHLLHAAGG